MPNFRPVLKYVLFHAEFESKFRFTIFDKNEFIFQQLYFNICQYFCFYLSTSTPKSLHGEDNVLIVTRW